RSHGRSPRLGTCGFTRVGGLGGPGRLHLGFHAGQGIVGDVGKDQILFGSSSRHRMWRRGARFVPLASGLILGPVHVLDGGEELVEGLELVVLALVVLAILRHSPSSGYTSDSS